MAPVAVIAETENQPVTATQPDGSSWTVDGNNYTCNSRISWPNFSSYKLGNLGAGETVMISSDIKASTSGDEATNAGGDSGYLFAVTDVNGNGVIEETEDTYYTVEISGFTDNRVNVVIERNNKSWSPVRTVRYLCPTYVSINFTVTFDSATSTINVYVNGELITSYTDTDPLTGTGYYLASKITNGVYRNLETSVGSTPDWVGDNDGKTVALDQDVYDSIVVPAGKSITIDLNGHYIFAPIVNYGTLTLIDSEGDGLVEVRRGFTSDTNAGGSIFAIDNFGTLTIDGATVIGGTTGANAIGIGINNRAGATLSVKSGEIHAISEKDNTCHGIYNRGVISEISGGRIISEMVYRVNYCSNAAIYNDGGTINTISGGEIYSRSNGRSSDPERYTTAILNTNSATIGEISGGYIHSEAFANGEVRSFGIYNVGGSTITEISGGVIEGYTSATSWAFGIKNENSTIGEISGGLIRSYIDHVSGNNSIALANLSSGSVNISGGVFWADGTGSIGRRAIRCQSSSVANLSGGAFYAAGDGNRVQQDGGTIAYATGYSLVKSNDSDYYFATTEGSVSENITADGYTVTTGGKSYTLFTSSEKASTGGVVYDSVSAAIDAAETGATVKLLGNSSSAITVAAGKNVTIDINGTQQIGKLTNNGTLTLTDGKGAGRIMGRSDASGEFVVVDNFGTLTIDGVNIRALGLGASTDADAIKNETGAHLTVLSGKIQSTVKNTYYGNAIKNYGTIDLISGGEIASEVSIPYSATSALNNVAINQQGASARIVLISGGNIWARNNNTGGNGNYSTAIRNNNASQVIEMISGGTFRAYALKNGSNQRVAFGILNENGTIVEISGGFIAGYTSGADFNFGIKNQATINKISGGYILAQKDTTEGGGNIIALANWGIVEDISGGTLYSRVGYAGANSYAVRTNNSGKFTNISGGTFGATRNYNSVLLTADGGANNIKAGYYLGGADSHGLREIENSYDYARVIYALGSSVTVGSNTMGRSFADMLDNSLDDTAVIKSAISGTTLIDNGSSSYVARLQSDYTGLQPADIVIVQLSTNDATQGQPLGTLDPDQTSGFDTSTIIGAIEFIINYAKTTWGASVVFYTNPYYESANYAAMVNAMPAIVEKWGIDVVDFYHSEESIGAYMTDSIHPNIAGYEWMAEAFEEYLEPTVTVSADKYYAVVGDTVEFTVTIKNAAKSKAFSVKPLYDDTKYELVSGEWIIDDSILSGFDLSIGAGVISWANMNNINTAVFKFVLRAIGGGDTEVGCEVKVQNSAGIISALYYVPTEVTLHVHEYGLPVWNWTEDYSSAAATFSCVEDGYDQIVTADVTSDTTNAGCEDDGVIVYTATVTFEGNVYTDVKEQTITATGHDYGSPTYEWSEDSTSVTATVVCNNHAEHVITETVETSYAITTDPGCETTGIGTYTANFVNTLFETQTKDVTIDAIGHNYGEATYTWAEDNSYVTATKVCENNHEHVITETVNTSYAVTTDPGCSTEGVGTYTAVFTTAGFETQTKDVTIAATGEHAYGDAVDNGNGTHSRTCTECNQVLTEDCADEDGDGSCDVCGHKMYILGDYNNDGIITSDDAVYMLNQINGEATAYQPLFDFNGDDDITGEDALYLLYHVFFKDLYPIVP